MSYGDLVEFLCPVLPSGIAGKSPRETETNGGQGKKSGNIKILKKEQQQKAKANNVLGWLSEGEPKYITYILRYAYLGTYKSNYTHKSVKRTGIPCA